VSECVCEVSDARRCGGSRGDGVVHCGGGHVDDPVCATKGDCVRASLCWRSVPNWRNKKALATVPKQFFLGSGNERLARVCLGRACCDVGAAECQHV
jgi:hypothetical protein